MEERSVVLKEARARRWNNTERRRRSEETEEERAIRFDNRRKINAAEKIERAVADSECTFSDEDEDEEGSASETERRAMEERSVVLKEARARRWNNTKRRRRSEEAEEERAISLDKRLTKMKMKKNRPAKPKDLSYGRALSGSQRSQGSALEQHEEEAAIRGDGGRRAIRFDKRRNINAAEKLERAVADSECTSSDEDEDEEGSASESEIRAMEERSVVLKARARRWNNTKRRRRSEEAEEERAISLDKRRKINAAEKLECAVADSERTSSDEDEDEEGSASETERRAKEERSVVLKEARARRWNNTERRRRSEETEEERAIRFGNRLTKMKTKKNRPAKPQDLSYGRALSGSQRSQGSALEQHEEEAAIRGD
ncbi:hypothetical protein V5799_015005 [Amblyomma americanum]|uniref:Uncharacterized protein n=1 Tax=Amblyomma americanum TaxID=6943 RepID=A0AAQ4E1F8_AMBAM